MNSLKMKVLWSEIKKVISTNKFLHSLLLIGENPIADKTFR